MRGAGLYALAALLVVLAGVFSAADAAIAPFSKARAEELVAEGRTGSRKLRHLVLDTHRYVNTMLLLRALCEIAAVVIVTVAIDRAYDGRWWPTVGTAVGVMLVVSYVVVGVAPRTLGKLHNESIALALAPVMVLLTTVLGPIPRLLIGVGNLITPGRGIAGGPFSTETELRELVDLAHSTSVIEEGERRMIHSVFDLSETVAREVMVPRNDVVYIERNKNLRQTMSLFLRSGFSRLPVIEENLDEVVGFAYLKDVARRDFEDPEIETTLRIETVMRPAYFVPESKPVDDLLGEMQARRQHVAVVVDEYGGTAGLITIEDILEEIVGEITDEYDASEEEAERLADGAVRVPSRFPIGDLDEWVGVTIEDDDVDSVGGLVTKLLGKVPIPGASVETHGLRFTAEQPTGRRNRIGSVVIRPLPPSADEDADAPTVNG
ncbi:MAG: hemolysin family protein [Nocardioides sp.]